MCEVVTSQALIVIGCFVEALLWSFSDCCCVIVQVNWGEATADRISIVVFVWCNCLLSYDYGCCDGILWIVWIMNG